MINFKQIFIWWHKQTIGTLFKTILFGKLVGKDENGNKYYKNKKDERWIIYAENIEASKITSEWFLWMHHTVDEPPNLKQKRYLWQKKHSENMSGTPNAYKPSKILRNNQKKKYDTWKI